MLLKNGGSSKRCLLNGVYTEKAVAPNQAVAPHLQKGTIKFYILGSSE